MATQELQAETVAAVHEIAPAKPTSDEQEWFDLLPIEKKLCGYSLGLGIALLAVFILVFEVL